MKVLKSLCLLVVSAIVVACGGNASKSFAETASTQNVTLSINTTGSSSPLVVSPITVSSSGAEYTVLPTQAVIPGQAQVGFGQVAILPPSTISAQSISVSLQGFPQILGAPFVTPMSLSMQYLLPGQSTFATLFMPMTIMPGGSSLTASGSFPIGTQFALLVSGGLSNEQFPDQCLDFCGWQFNLSLSQLSGIN